MRNLPLPIFLLLCGAIPAWCETAFEQEVRPVLETYCVKCHGGEKVKGKVDFSALLTDPQIETQAELWDLVSIVMEDGEMPPKDEPQPSAEEQKQVLDWLFAHFVDVEARPAVFKPRRLSANEYRNTLRSLFGFDLEVAIIKAEQTIVEKSLVKKLLPIDPPGKSGFVNDTYNAPLSRVLWDQYSYLADAALEQFLDSELSAEKAESVVRDFLPRAYRRPVSEQNLVAALANLEGKSGKALRRTLKEELKVVLMSPQFLYRGFLMERDAEEGHQLMDGFELAERLSYFLWEDSPDAELQAAAAGGSLTDPQKVAEQVDRMLASPKARSLAESFGVQWLELDTIDDSVARVIERNALKTQPVDFLNYLFTENRPVMELIDSETTFVNDQTAKFYPQDRKQMTKYFKPKGVEKMIHPNQKITLENTEGRGGILTMPGVLTMNHGPIIRGTWMMRRILGDHLGEPPPDVPPIQAVAKKGLTFRQQFEAHRADPTCARCHNKIDPLGFALQAYDAKGAFKGDKSKTDTSGKLPSGEKFANFAELKAILISSQREKVIQNAVEQAMAYALCRKLEPFDRPTTEAITAKILETNGTWRDLFVEIANSLPFRETIISGPNS